MRRSALFPGLALLILLLSGCTKITPDNFAKIQEGMTYEEVTAILGPPTDSKSIGIGPLSGTAAIWSHGTTQIDIKFLNERVQLKSLDTENAEGGS